MEGLTLKDFQGISVSMAPFVHGNISTPPSDHSATFSVEEILRVLGDPRDHSNVVRSRPISMTDWLTTTGR